MKKCMELKAEDRLEDQESVEADMADEVQPYRKTDYKPIIYIYSAD